MKQNTTESGKVNALLERLPKQLRQALMQRMHAISLPANTMLYTAGQRPEFAHFIISGVATISAVLPGGELVPVGIVGDDGLVESAHLLGRLPISSTAIVRVPSVALRMPFEELQQKFLSSAALRDQVLENVQQAKMLSEQVAACNALHESLGRLATWLLLLTTPLALDEIALTQDQLAKLLSVRRTTITMIVQPLQQRRILRVQRGRIFILDRAALAISACECFSVISTFKPGLRIN